MLGQGEYVVECMSWENYLHIKCPVNIVGSRAVLGGGNCGAEGEHIASIENNEK
jgi:hypothetical protein